MKEAMPNNPMVKLTLECPGCRDKMKRELRRNAAQACADLYRAVHALCRGEVVVRSKLA